jgi:hypothetical protein
VAHETAVLTFELEDQFSAKFAEIVGKLDDFKKRLEDVSKAGREGFKGVSEQVQQVGDKGAGVNTALSAMRTHMADAFLNLNRSMAGTVEGLGKMEGRLATIGSTIATVGGKFGPVARSIGLVGGAAAAAAGSVWLLGRHLAQSYEHMQNLQIQLGMSEASIKTFERAFERFGKTPEDAHRALDNFNKAVEETRKLAGSRIIQDMTTGIAQAGPQIANATQQIFRQIREGKISKEEGFRQWMQQVYGIQPEETRRKLAEIIGEQFADLEQLRRHLPQVIPPTVYSEQMKKALENLNKTISDEMEKASNAWTEGWNKMGPQGIAEQEKAIKALSAEVQKLIPLMPKVFTESIKVAAAFLSTINDIIAGIRLLHGLWTDPKTSPLNPAAPRNLTPEQIEQIKRNPKPLDRLLYPDIAGTELSPERRQQEEAVEREHRRWYRPRGTPQRFMGDGPADLSGLHINADACGRMVSDPELIARGRSRIIDLRGQQQFGQQAGQQLAKLGDPIRETAVGEDIRRSADATREGTEYLRDIRDILKWLQDQLQGQGAGDGAPGAGASAGGRGFGGRLGGFAGGGGGRTGSPWFGGRAGRGTGGVPNMPQGGPGAGQDFYNQALAAVRQSGLVGQIPPDGAQFGITTGSAEEWARFMTGVAKAESNFDPRTKNLQDRGGSFGVLQYAHGQVPGGNAYDTAASIQAFIRDAQQAVSSGGIRSPESLLRRRFSTIGSHPERTIRNLVNYGNYGGGQASIPLQEGDITGTGRGSGGRFNVPAGTRIQGQRETVTLSNGQRVTVNARAAAQFQGFFNDLIAAGAPVRNLGGFGGRNNPSQHPIGLAVDWAQHSRNVVDRDVLQWMRQNSGLLNQLEAKWGMSGGEHWRSPDTGHFSIDTLFGSKHLAQLHRGSTSDGHAVAFTGAGDQTPIRDIRDRLVGLTGPPRADRAVPHLGGPFMAGHADQIPFARRGQDGGRIGGAEITVHVHAPRGQKVTHSAKGHGALAHPKVKTSQTHQMASTGQHGTDDPNRYGEE